MSDRAPHLLYAAVLPAVDGRPAEARGRCACGQEITIQGGGLDDLAAWMRAHDAGRDAEPATTAGAAP